jgi:hypothetical protein
MILVRFMGGLGNQMFQYAAALRLASRHNTTLKLDLSFLYDHTLQGHTFRDFDLVIFNPTEEKASAREVREFRRLHKRTFRTRLKKLVRRLTLRPARHYFVETHAAFDPAVLELPDETFLEGYFQNERYFSDIIPEIRRRFKLQPDETQLPPATRALADKIRADNGVCLHVRRGDYVTNASSMKVIGFCTLDYYQKALAELRARGINRPVYIFSDDINWCRENFPESDELTVVGDEHAGPRSATHFWLMTLCRDFVIPNSSFSWWAAWLSDSPNKTVIRPSRWFRAPELRDVDICPAAWLKVSNE